MGTFKSGVDNIQTHHWSNAKPANLREDAEEAVMPKRGRPAKTPSPVKVPEPTDASQPAITSPEIKTTTNVNKPVESFQTVGGKRATRNPNPIYVAEVNPLAGNSNTKNAWSASKSELANINQWINSGDTLVKSLLS